MSYPPPQPGGYPPYPPNQGQAGNLGFAQQHQQPQPGQGPGYPLYPQGGGGFPIPPSNQAPGAPCPPAGAPYNPYPGAPGGNPSSPYPPQPTVAPMQYAPQSNAAPNPSPFNSAPYPPQSANPPYAPQGTNSPYPPQGTNSPYPPQGTNSPYPPQGTNSPYPPQRTNSPYPPQGTNSPYPPQATASPYPPQGTNSPYPPQAANSPYPQTVSPNPYSPQAAAPQQSSPYPPSGSPYPPAAAAAASTYPNISQSSFSTQQQSSSSPQAPYTAGSMWPYTERPTIRPSSSLDASTDAAELRKAMKGFGTDEQTIIRILGRRTSVERQQILMRYQQSFGRDLVKDLKSELGGNFESVAVALMTPLPAFLASQLHAAIKGVGTNENTLIEILCANDNNSLRQIKASYQSQFGHPIEADIRADTSGDFERLMVAMAAAFRDEATDPSLAPGLAQTLYNAGAKKVGTDEVEFRRILSSYSYPLLRCVFQEYVRVSGGKTFQDAIKSELSGDFMNAMLALYESINNRAAFFAHYMNNAMKGMGTKDDALIRIVISRSEIDMGNIKDEYTKLYGKRLEDAISSETSGDYKKILLALVQG